MRSYAGRLAVTGLVYLTADLLAVGWMRAFCAGQVVLAVGLGFACAFPAWIQGWFADEKCPRRRCGYIVAAAIAGAVGTGAVMLLWP